MDAQEVYARLEERKRTAGPALAAAYRCEPGAFAVAEALAPDSGLTPYQLINDVELAFERHYRPMLEMQLEVDADYVPDFDPVCGVCVIAAAFGCEEKYHANEMPWAMPVLESITEVDHLRKPDLAKARTVQRLMSQMRWLQDRTGGRVPIELMDLQSPFTVACQMRHYEDLLMDMIDDPERVKKLIEIITDTTIEFCALQRQVCEVPAFPGRNFPCCGEDMGICIADDSAVIPLSPAMYEEFCLPSMQRIAEAETGVFIHSCGDYLHQVDNLLRIPKLRSMQMHTGPGEIDSAPAWRKFHGRVSLWSDTNDVSLGGVYRGDRYWECYEQYVLPRLLEVGVDGLVLRCPPADTPAERQTNVIRLREILRSATGPKAGA